ncbi:hypothetical protein F5X68DRAFT_237332 [Plectosphaerella plurivora]|uniref:Uncharacterized protein n=1 Tax=Plectosphaerella plurivora TaxID=936078 RepID=A0A9P8V115_9PEZI|nr:hypothetical protein F5X68DRAFT_237332 [Plectosphaerella plurivora]
MAFQPRHNSHSRPQKTREMIFSWADGVNLNDYMSSQQERAWKEARQIREHNNQVEQEREMFLLGWRYPSTDIWSIHPHVRNLHFHAHGESNIVWARQRREGRPSLESEASGNGGPGRNALGKRKFQGHNANSNKVGESSRSQITQPNTSDNDDDDEDDNESFIARRTRHSLAEQYDFLAVNNLTRVSRHIPHPEDPDYETANMAAVWARRAYEPRIFDSGEEEYDADWEKSSASFTENYYFRFSDTDDEEDEDEEERDLETNNSTVVNPTSSLDSLSGYSSGSTESTAFTSVFSSSEEDEGYFSSASSV